MNERTSSYTPLRTSFTTINSDRSLAPGTNFPFQYYFRYIWTPGLYDPKTTSKKKKKTFSRWRGDQAFPEGAVIPSIPQVGR